MALKIVLMVVAFCILQPIVATLINRAFSRPRGPQS